MSAALDRRSRCWFDTAVLLCVFLFLVQYNILLCVTLFIVIMVLCVVVFEGHCLLLMVVVGDRLMPLAATGVLSLAPTDPKTRNPNRHPNRQSPTILHHRARCCRRPAERERGDIRRIRRRSKGEDVLAVAGAQHGGACVRSGHAWDSFRGGRRRCLERRQAGEPSHPPPPCYV